MIADFSLLTRLRERQPLIHCVSNIVTAPDCANILLAAGGRPIMAQEPKEAAEISSRCAATVLNTGTPNDGKFRACQIAGIAANQAGHPVILDPVGVGASGYRLEQVSRLLEETAPTIIRGNLGEIQALLRISSVESGVDCVSDSDPAQRQRCAAELAQNRRCVVYLSGAEDIVTDGARLVSLSGGSTRMRQVTGAGCMLSVLLGGFAAVTENVFDAAVCAGGFWKACAAYAETRGAGTGTFRMALFDAASLLEPREIANLCGATEIPWPKGKTR